MVRKKAVNIRFDDLTEGKFNEFRAKASISFIEKGENLPTSHLIQELVKAQLNNIAKSGGTSILGEAVAVT